MKHLALPIATTLTAALLSAAALAQTPTPADPAQAPLVAPAEPTPPETVEPQVIEPIPAAQPAPMAAPGPICCPIEVVRSRTTLAAKRLIRCEGPPVDRAVCVANPAECCGQLYEVPLCVPVCCVGEPRVCNESTGPLGRGYVDLVWDCGYVARLAFRKHGGVIITYTAG
ncbi:hypothetical protein [Botrimarina sp.]|uniref:hypothetical protein n=1 Tax=Botrimarina sp. TaxID=2795802 RepID=UPI0032EAB29B